MFSNLICSLKNFSLKMILWKLQTNYISKQFKVKQFYDVENNIKITKIKGSEILSKYNIQEILLNTRSVLYLLLY